MVIVAGLWFLPKETPEQTRQPSSVLSEKAQLIVTGFDQDLDLNKISDFAIFKSYVERMISEVDKEAGNKFWGPAYFRVSAMPSGISAVDFKIILNYLKNESDPEKVAIIHKSLELNYAEKNQDTFRTIAAVLKKVHHFVLSDSMIKGKYPAQNINQEEIGDLSLIDPTDSHLWKRPANLPGQNLFLGFNRSSNLSIPDVQCQLLEISLIKCGDKKFKIKLSGKQSEVFTARIFWALGFNVKPVDFQSSVKLSYDSRIPVEFISEAVLTNGKIINGKELATILQTNALQVATIRTTSLQIEDVSDEEVAVGPWDLNDFNFKNHREMRGMILLAAWLNWTKIDSENNQLVLQKDNQFKFMITGWSSLNNFSELNDSFTDSNSKPKSFKIKNFRTTSSVQPFYEATIDDIKWMARLIRSLTNKQIADAFKGAGFSLEEQGKGLEKLLLRREKMLKDLGL